MKKLLVLPALLVFLSSCATMKNEETSSAPTAAGEDAVGQTLKNAEVPDAEKKGTTFNSAAIENLTIDEVIKIEEPNTANLYDNSRYDFPITVNSKVEGWIDYFTGRGRPHMERYLGRSSRYIPLMKEILKKNGLPEDLVYLALIESGFNLRAKSRSRAVGPWQFMKATGKRYGLRVDAWIDQRRDPVKSTEAAAKYLKDLYLMFESWYLAASAYNAGEYKILRAISANNTHNFWRISQTSSIRRETKDYVPKLIAAAIIAKNPAKYGFADVEYEEPLEFEVVSVDFPIHMRDIATFVETSEDDIHDLNPELARGVVPPGIDEYEVRVPVGTKVVLERALSSMKGKGTKPVMPFEHIVKAGETLRSVARRYRVPLKELANVNNLSPKEKVPPGSSLIIPNRSVSSTPTETTTTTSTKTNKVVKRQSSSTSGREDNFITHTVRRGESLWSISEKYSVTVQEIFRWNNLKKSRIFPGKKLRIRPENRDESAILSQGSKRRSGTT